MKQYVPDLGISLEKGTDTVPNDGRYHVTLDGVIVASYRSQSASLRHYKRLIDESGGYPKQPVLELSAEERRAILIKESISKRLDLAEDYWDAAAKAHKGNRYRW